MTTQHAMLRGALALGLFALVTAGSVALTRAVTAERIAEHQLAYQHRQLQEVLPAAAQAWRASRSADGIATRPANCSASSVWAV